MCENGCFLSLITCEVIYYQDNASWKCITRRCCTLDNDDDDDDGAKEKEDGDNDCCFLPFTLASGNTSTNSRTRNEREEKRKKASGRSQRERKNCLSLQKNHVSIKEDEKRKGEARDDKFKTLSFASIYSPGRKRKNQVRIVEMHGFRSFALSLCLSRFLFLSLSRLLSSPLPLLTRKSINPSRSVFCSHPIRK